MPLRRYVTSLLRLLREEAPRSKLELREDEERFEACGTVLRWRGQSQRAADLLHDAVDDRKAEAASLANRRAALKRLRQHRKQIRTHHGAAAGHPDGIAAHEDLDGLI